jgi:uncharacterized protein YjiS (DUF1127 family)
MTTCMNSSAHTRTRPLGSTVLHDPPTLRARAAAIARRGWRAYWERQARRATVLILCSLDERTLRDIGISRSEISSCVYGQGGDRLRRYHESWPWRSRE